MILYDERRKRSFALGDRYGSGGEADVYRLPDTPHHLAKIYKSQPTTETVRKLGHMVANPPEDPSARLKHRSFAWPQELLVNQHNAVVGYLMPLAHGNTLLKVFNPHLRAQTGWRWDWRESHIAAYNLAATMGALHERNYVIGDVNESNVFVTPRGLVTLLDTDSFQVTNGATIYRCLVGKPEYTPPELQRVTDFKDVTRAPAHDRFGLGVLIFQLLMAGNHPFRGRWLGSDEPKKLEERIAEGLFPYDKSHRKLVLPPASAPPLNVLHPSLQALVKRCFITGHVVDGSRRPDPREWMAALDEARTHLRPCKACHDYYSAHLNACPWCGNPKRALWPMAQPFRKQPQASPSAKPTQPTNPTPARPRIILGQRSGLPSRPQPQPQPPVISTRAPTVVPAPATSLALKERPIVRRLLLLLFVAAIGYVLLTSGASGSASLGSLALCDARPVARQPDGTAIPWRVNFRITSVAREAGSIRLHAQLERIADQPNLWRAHNPDDPIWLEGNDGRRYRLLEMGGFPMQTINLERGVTHDGWFRFEQPDADTFEFVHPNIQRRFLINLADETCTTQGVGS
jgi:serine/threonine protein kinase